MGEGLGRTSEKEGRRDVARGPSRTGGWRTGYEFIQVSDVHKVSEQKDSCTEPAMSERNRSPEKERVIKQIKSLIHCLVNIKDETGEFLMPIPDGRIIDTKGWEDWEVICFV